MTYAVSSKTLEYLLTVSCTICPSSLSFPSRSARLETCSRGYRCTSYGIRAPNGTSDTKLSFSWIMRSPDFSSLSRRSHSRHLSSRCQSLLNCSTSFSILGGMNGSAYTCECGWFRLTPIDFPLFSNWSTYCIPSLASKSLKTRVYSWNTLVHSASDISSNCLLWFLE